MINYIALNINDSLSHIVDISLNTIEGSYVDLFMCEACSSIVVDTAAHNTWHAEIQSLIDMDGLIA
jgi:hypothetical protein